MNDPVHNKESGHYVAISWAYLKISTKISATIYWLYRIFSLDVFENGKFQQFRSLSNFKISRQFFLSALFYSLTFVSFLKWSKTAKNGKTNLEVFYNNSHNLRHYIENLKGTPHYILYSYFKKGCSCDRWCVMHDPCFIVRGALW